MAAEVNIVEAYGHASIDKKIEICKRYYKS